MRMLRRNPWLASRTKHVTVVAKHADVQAAFQICRALILLLPNMDALARFDWMDDEPPPLEMLWSELLDCCPRLKHVKVSFGNHVPKPDSAVRRKPLSLGGN
jgi:hypothetical protein